MPKSTKKKKEQTADFSKPKLKLGKGKRPASNAVDTSFKARSIALPQQSIASTKDAWAPTTKRRLTLDDLLGHLKHYSANVRKDALQGLHELLDEHRDLIDSNLLSLIDSCVRLIADEDAGVRQALHSFLSWLFRRVPQDNLAPHAPTLLLFTASAQTNIFPEIRMDSIRILDLLLKCMPTHVVTGCMETTTTGSSQASHGRKILEGYVSLLNVGAKFSGDGLGVADPSSSSAGQASASTVMLSPMSKSIVLKSLSKFLSYAVSSDLIDPSDRTADELIPLWFLSNSFPSPQAFNSFTGQLTPTRTSGISKRDIRLWGSGGVDKEDDEDYTDFFPLFRDFEKSSHMDLHDLDRVLVDIERLASTEGASNEVETAKLRLTSSLCRALHPVLVSAFLDCAPSVFSPTQACPEAELELISSILEIGRSLYGRLLRDNGINHVQRQTAQDELSVLLGHMAAYFPFGENSMFARDMKTETVLQNMNLMYCELFSLLSLAVDPDAQQIEGADGPTGKRRRLNNAGAKRSKSNARFSSTIAAKQAIRVQEYVVQRLRGSGSAISAPSVRPMGHALTAQTYVALLPTLWWLLCQPVGESGEGSLEVLSAILQHAMKAGSISGVKTPATEFVARLLQLQCEPSYTGQFLIGPTSPEEIRTLVQEWVLHLPKVLWELADKNPVVTELILLFLLRLFQRRSWLNNSEILSSLRTRMCPFFMIQHPSRGEIRGPYAKLKCSSGVPEPNTPLNPLKRLALDVTAILISMIPPPTSGRGRPPLRPGQRVVQDATGTSGPNEEAEEYSKMALGIAVEKAVTGTDEEGYWHAVSML